jgi:hypothetical protein
VLARLALRADFSNVNPWVKLLKNKKRGGCVGGSNPSAAKNEKGRQKALSSAPALENNQISRDERTPRPFCLVAGNNRGLGAGGTWLRAT